MVARNWSWEETWRQREWARPDSEEAVESVVSLPHPGGVTGVGLLHGIEKPGLD